MVVLRPHTNPGLEHTRPSEALPGGSLIFDAVGTLSTLDERQRRCRPEPPALSMKRSEPDVRIEFTNSSAAAGSVRRALAHDLDVADHLADDVALVASELVTNVVRHAGTGGVVELWACPGEVRIEVHDAAPALPQMRERGGPDGGFGLRIVDRLTTQWGHRLTCHGKTVWAVVRASPSTTP